MSECIKKCQLCSRFLTSQSIVYNATTNQLIVDLPAGSYQNCSKYCIAFVQSIPTETTINAQVVFTIGGDQTIAYPFLNKDCTPIYASQVRTRRIYPTRVNTAVNSGVFKYIGDCCLPSNATTINQSIPVSTTTAVVNQSQTTPVAPTRVKS